MYFLTFLRRTPILALTASHTSEVYEKIHQVGMDDILCKPFKKDELYAKLALWVNQEPNNENVEKTS